ncbi:MAG: OmpH family outer membrane protein [Desulfuromonadaceae bacterium]|nr:OmpH family outer membrane protein [Desulfuromonadaceae bacterium]MDD2849428.1 OmpH family outer membrane protein [Desulfuromonadaceae bacterium]MDD4130004.1 OmpH family outer membrane protein [Desulfuromonadaceae bacterium]
MPTVFKTILIACFFAVPSFAFAAETPAEMKPTAPPQTTPAPHIARLGYVDIARIAAEAEQGKALKTLLTTKRDHLQAKVDVKKKQLEKLKASIEAKVAKMSPQQREAKSKEFQKRVEEFQKFARTSEEEFFALQNKETRALYEAIEQAAVAHGKVNGFAAIVVKKELLYIGSSAEAVDVTDALIKELNQAGLKK